MDQNMTHELDRWIAGLRPVSHLTFRAYIAEGWDLLKEPYDPARWTAEQVRLARMVFRPSPEELAKFSVGWPAEGRSDLREAWTCPTQTLLEGARTQLVQQEFLFSINFGIQGIRRFWTWAWQAFSFTSDLAVISEVEDAVIAEQHILPKPLGLVPTATLYPSTALLFMNCHHSDEGADRFGDPRHPKSSSKDFWEEIRPSGIPLRELYRLLLAAYGRGGDSVLTLEADQLEIFREAGMKYGFARVRYVASR